MLVLTHRLTAGECLRPVAVPVLTLALTAAERTRSRHRFTTEEGEVVYLRLPRGTVLQHGDWLFTAAVDNTGIHRVEQGSQDQQDSQVDRGNRVDPDNPIAHPGHPNDPDLPLATVHPDSPTRVVPPCGPAVQVVARPEPVLTVTAASPLALLQATYHLGNRHVPLEITPHYLRLTPDPVLQAMLMQLGVTVHSEIAPFLPIGGAYHHSH